MAAAPPAPAARKGGVLWSTINGGASVVLPFVVFALFARMMAPAELSLVMLAVAMLELVKAVGPQGIYDVLLTYPESDAAHYRTAAALFAGAGVALGAVYCGLVMLSPWLLRAALPPVLLLLALKVVFDYAVMQPQAVLVRRGAMRRLGSRGVAAGLVAGAGGIGIALATTPIVGLTAYYVLQSLVTFLMTAVNTASLVPPRLDGAAARAMASQGSRASGVRLTAAVSNYLDQLILGAMAPPAQVGAYNLGKRLEVVSMTLGASFSQLLFQPTFAQARPEERVHHMARGIAAISLVCGTPIVVLALFHAQAVPFVFGAQWAGAAGVVAVLAASGFVRALGGVAGALYTVTGRNGRLLALGIFSAATNMLMIVIFARFGILWAALAVLVRNAANTLLLFLLTGDATGHLVRIFRRNCFVPLAAAAVAAWVAGRGAALALGQFAPVVQGVAMLAVGGAAGMAVSFAVLRRRL